MSKNDLKKQSVEKWYVERFRRFEASLNGSSRTPFHRVRRKAIEHFERLGFPTTRDEEWKYTSVAPLTAQWFDMAAAAGTRAEIDLSPFLFEGMDCSLLVFVDGFFSEKLSLLSPSSGVTLGSLREAFQRGDARVNDYLAALAPLEKEAFTALNTAFTRDGSFVYVEKNVAVDQPLHIVHLFSGQKNELALHPRTLIIAGEGSRFRYAESFHHLDGGVYFQNTVSEVFVQENASVEYIKIQDESRSAFHISNLNVRQERNSRFNSVYIDLGGGLVRNNLNVTLNDSNCETHLFGFYLGGENQLIDNHTFIDHAKPNCFSNELYKGILGGRAKGVFNGKILVRPDAQKTNALQSNKTLLLSRDASINAKPQLKIYADDVKCTHGATIGQLDEEALFYLRSRGIDLNSAMAMLRYAFVSDVFASIPLPEAQQKLADMILRRLKTIETENGDGPKE